MSCSAWAWVYGYNWQVSLKKIQEHKKTTKDKL